MLADKEVLLPIFIITGLLRIDSATLYTSYGHVAVKNIVYLLIDIYKIFDKFDNLIIINLYKFLKF